MFLCFLLAQAPGWYAYDFPPEARAKLHGGWAKYRGQAQKWFLVRLTGPETQVDTTTTPARPLSAVTVLMNLQPCRCCAGTV